MIKIMIKKLIKKRILNIPKSTPTFVVVRKKNSAIILNCTNKYSIDWLKILSSKYQINNIPLRALCTDEPPRRYQVVVYVMEPDMPAKEAVKLRKNKTWLWQP